MDIQLKRGLLDVCVLAAIKNEESYGYKIIKDLSDCISLSESTRFFEHPRVTISMVLRFICLHQITNPQIPFC